MLCYFHHRLQRSETKKRNSLLPTRAARLLLENSHDEIVKAKTPMTLARLEVFRQHKVKDAAALLRKIRFSKTSRDARFGDDGAGLSQRCSSSRSALAGRFLKQNVDWLRKGFEIKSKPEQTIRAARCPVFPLPPSSQVRRSGNTFISFKSEQRV
jgi:hypothetical protein